jgi:lipopolysaccharide export system permease protein
MKSYDRYVIARLLRGFLLVFVVLGGLFGVVALIDEMDDVGRGVYGWSDAFLHVALRLPNSALELVPLIGLLGAVLGLGSMAGSNELVALRAVGVSAWRLSASALKAGFLLVVVALLVAEYVGPPLEKSAQTQRSYAIHERGPLRLGRGFWFREGTSFIEVGSILRGRRLADVTIYDFHEDGRLRKRTSASAAEVLESGRWLLRNVESETLGERGIELEHDRMVSWQSTYGPALLELTELAPESLSLSDLVLYVESMRGRGQASESYQLRLWRILFLPLVTGAMILLALPFVFALRQSSSGLRMALACLVGATTYALDRIGGHAGMLAGMSPILTALAPGLLILAVAVVFVRRLD